MRAAASARGGPLLTHVRKRSPQAAPAVGEPQTRLPRRYNKKRLPFRGQPFRYSQDLRLELEAAREEVREIHILGGLGGERSILRYSAAKLRLGRLQIAAL